MITLKYKSNEHLLHSGWSQLVTSAAIQTTVRSTFNNVRLIKQSRGTCTVHLGVGHEADDRSAVCINEQRLWTSKQHSWAAAGLAAFAANAFIYWCHQHSQLQLFFQLHTSWRSHLSTSYTTAATYSLGLIHLHFHSYSMSVAPKRIPKQKPLMSAGVEAGFPSSWPNKFQRNLSIRTKKCKNIRLHTFIFIYRLATKTNSTVSNLIAITWKQT